MKVLHSICQQIWKTQQWPRDWKSQLLFRSQRKAMPKNAQTTTQLHSYHMLLLLLLSRFSRVRLCATPWTAAYQAPPSMGFARQEYWSGLPLPSPYHMLVMLKILQARLQQYVNRELPDAQAGFRKGRGTRDQIANIHWIME